MHEISTLLCLLALAVTCLRLGLRCCMRHQSQALRYHFERGGGRRATAEEASALLVSL